MSIKAKFLYNLILKDVIKGSGQASGIMSIGRDVRKLADKKFQNYITAAKRQGVDLDKLSEQELKYTLEMNKPKPIRAISADSPEGQGITRDLFNMLDRRSGKNVIKTDFGKPFAEEIGSVDNIVNDITRMEPVAAMKEVNKVLGQKGKYKNLSKQDSEKIFNNTDDWVNQRDPADLYDYKNKKPFREDPNFDPDDPDFNPEDFAYGGVAGMLGERPGYNEGLTAKQIKRQDRENFASKVKKFIDMQGSGSISGKQQITDAPEGITSNTSLTNLIANLDIPISEKISLIGDVQYNKFRDKIEKGDEELFIEDPASYINKNIGIGYNQGNDGLSGSFMYNPDTGSRDLRFKISKKFADGGIARQNFAMGRRAFMKLLGGAAAGIGAAKAGLGSLFKTAKPVTKAAEVITTPNAVNKPAWFDALVTRIVNEGDDVTKKFATKERELVHTKQINDFSEVTVYRDLDTNTVRVNYGSKLRTDPTKPYEKGNISRAVNDPDQVDLIVKGPEDIEPTLITNREGFVQRRGGKTKAEFEAYESEPRVTSPDGDMEFDGERIVNSVDDLMEDVSPLEEFATRKKLTGDKAAKAQKKREDYERFTQDPMEQANYLETKYGPAPEPDDFASGGIARMLGE